MKTAHKIHQALHGYDEGHRCLASSLQLDSADFRALQMLSDASGSLTEAFDGYLTGYLLPSGEYYVFARTWIAHEMPRPGCVWTHSLIVGNRHLGSVKLSALYGLFRRPSAPSNLTSSYKSELLVPDVPEHAFTLPENRMDVVRRLLAAAYFVPCEAVVQAANHAEEYKEIVFALWEQQWGALRCKFSFSTGSLTERRLNKQPLYLQIGPRDAIEPTKRKYSSDQHVSDVLGQEYVGLDLLLDDLSVAESPYKALVREVGDELPGEFACMAELAKFAAIGLAPNSVQEMADKTLSTWAESSLLSEHPTILLPFLGAATHSNVHASMTSFSEGAVVEALIRSERMEPWLLDVLELEARVYECYRRDCQLGVRLLSMLKERNDDVDSVYRRIMKRVAQVMGMTQVKEILSTAEGLAFDALHMRPDLWGTRGIWRDLKSDRATELLAIAYRDLGADEFGEVVGGVIEDRGTTDGVETLCGVSSAIVPDVLNELHEVHGDEEVSNWVPTIMRLCPHEVFEWIASHAEDSADFVARMVGSMGNPVLVARYARSVEWRAVAQAMTKDATSSLLYAFCFPLMVKRWIPYNEDMLTRTFRVLHEAITTGSLPERSWDQLAPHLPDALSSDTADQRSERLRRALLRYISSVGVKPLVVLRVARENEVFRKLVEVTGNTWQHRWTIMELARAVKKKKYRELATKEQREVLARWKPR